MAKKSDIKEKTSQIKISEDSYIGSQYAQLVNVNVTDFDVTLQFIFVNPRTGKRGHVVSRVTMPIPVAKSLASSIENTIKLHTKQKGGKKDD